MAVNRVRRCLLSQLVAWDRLRACWGYRSKDDSQSSPDRIAFTISPAAHTIIAETSQGATAEL